MNKSIKCHIHTVEKLTLCDISFWIALTQRNNYQLNHISLVHQISRDKPPFDQKNSFILVGSDQAWLRCVISHYRTLKGAGDWYIRNPLIKKKFSVLKCQFGRHTSVWPHMKDHMNRCTSALYSYKPASCAAHFVIFIEYKAPRLRLWKRSVLVYKGFWQKRALLQA